MGKAESKMKSSYRKKHHHIDELQISVKERFLEISNGQPTIDKSTFFKSTAAVICSQLQTFIYESLCKPENAITEQRFLHFAEMMLGDPSQQSEALLQLQQPLKQVVEALVLSFFKCEQLDNASTPLLVDFLMDEMPAEPNLHNLSNFIHHKMILLIIIKQISERLFLKDKVTSKLLPEAGKSSLLTPAALCLLYANLPEDSRAIWKLLFSSEKYGESFIKLLKSVDGAGPCLIIIETASGRVFGAFASHGFICGPTHQGDNRCFLFEDRQILRIYNATGYNSNYGYLNSHQVSLPNGIGMGGNGENWSFFLQEDFSSGISTPTISTFEKCWLAGESVFKPKNVEIWQIGERRQKVEEEEEEQKLLQDEFAQQRISTNKRETRALLEMSGREFRGDVFRKEKKS